MPRITRSNQSKAKQSKAKQSQALTVPEHAVVDQRGPRAAHERQHGNGGRGRRGREAEEEGHRQSEVEEEEQQKHARCEHNKRQGVPDSELQRLLALRYGQKVVVGEQSRFSGGGSKSW